MRFLVEREPVAKLAQVLEEAGHDAISLIDRGLHRLGDDAVLDLARSERRVIISADCDFGTLLARQRPSHPQSSSCAGRLTDRPKRDAMLILANLETIRSALEDGCIAVFRDVRVRVRVLPLGTTST